VLSNNVDNVGIRSFIHSFIHSFIYSFIHACIYSFIHLFIYFESGNMYNQYINQ